MGVSSWRSQTSNSLAKRSEAPARPHDLRASVQRDLEEGQQPSAREKTDPFRVEACRVRENRDWNRALRFIWARVVLLCGFSITLDKTDFWFITIILLIEETRIFSRSHELEWQHQATWSITDARVSSFRALRSNSLSMMQPVRAFFGGPLFLLPTRMKRKEQKVVMIIRTVGGQVGKGSQRAHGRAQTSPS
ncbi:hypothetical protein SAY86_024575 [Trapa natans]|uniref:Uncharacterized protein n=1 Tax=Trapa natans TaxID=22666 RepID=A0AAN7MPL9_TRANT|nr:hypothetical protein SAY86_024575 [Trapa natans]